MKPFVSILVRARNDEAIIGRTLEGIFAQQVDFPFEVVVCDDASTDRTRAVAAGFPVRFFDRPEGEYKPGRTLNALVRAAEGDIVVFNNSDAIPLDRNWLAELVKPLLADRSRPVFAFANQLPRPDAAALVRKDSERAFGDGRVQATWKFFFSLASSATWRKMLLETPFDERIQYSEDVEWTWRNSRREVDPVRVVYCPAAKVEHSHNYTLKELARRFRPARARRRRARDAARLGVSRQASRRLAGNPLRPHPATGAARLPLARHTRGGGKVTKTLVYLEKATVRGGIEIFAERHVARLRAAGREVEVAGSLPDDAAGFLAQFDEIVVHKCTDLRTLEKFPPERTTLYVHDHDPICPRSYAYTPMGRNCSRAGGLWPCLFCAPLCRNWRPALGRVFSQRRRIAAMSRLKRIVVISKFMQSRLVANGIAAERIAVEPPKIDTGKTAEPVEADVDLLFVGQLIRGKGVQLLLQALARMKAQRTLDIVGTGNMEPKLKALAAELGVGDRVRFRGFQANPLDWMRAAKCVVVPSFWQEPYGLVAAEAVALGRKVVAFAVGGLPEACGGKATLIAPGDIAALAQALETAEPQPTSRKEPQP